MTDDIEAEFTKVERLAEDVINDLPNATRAERLREAMRRCRGSMNPLLVHYALFARERRAAGG